MTMINILIIVGIIIIISLLIYYGYQMGYFKKFITEKYQDDLAAAFNAKHINDLKKYRAGTPGGPRLTDHLSRIFGDATKI